MRIVLPPFPDPSVYTIASLAFLPGGRDLVVLQNSNHPPSVLRRIDAKTGEIEGRPLRVGRVAAIGLFGPTDRGHVFVTSAHDDETREIDARRLRAVRRYPVGDAAGALSPDGRAFALGSSDGTVRLVDRRSGRARRFEGRHEAGVLRLAFTPDGRRLVSSDASGGVIVWDVADGEIIEELSAHRGAGLGTRGLPGRTHALQLRGSMAARSSGTCRAIDGSYGPSPSTGPLPSPTPRAGSRSAPMARRLALTHSDGAVDLIDTRTLRRRGSVRALHGFAAAVAFSPDGRLLAVAGEGGQRHPLACPDARSGGRAARAAGRLPGARLLPRREAAGVGRDRGRASPAAGLERAPAHADRLPRDVGVLARLQPGRRTDCRRHGE